MITGATTLHELEAIAREHHVQSILLERPPNGRSGVACRLERADRVVVVKTGATVADAIAAALAELVTRPGIRGEWIGECGCAVGTAINGICQRCRLPVSG